MRAAMEGEPDGCRLFPRVIEESNKLGERAVAQSLKLFRRAALVALSSTSKDKMSKAFKAYPEMEVRWMKQQGAD